MIQIVEQFTEKAAKTVKNWWMLLVAGALCIVAGIVVFCNPSSSYATLSIVIGVLMLVTGFTELIMAVSSRNWFMTRSYNIIGGMLDIVVGIMLCALPQVTMTVLPIFLGVWLIYHSFMIISISSDLKSFRIPGSGWMTAGGILLLILAMLIVLKPFSLGVGVIVALLGTGLIVLGAILIGYSLKIRKLHKYIEKVMDDMETIEEQ
ncbi:MAG: HdeD family acid-resistance protein [Candidatus Cryptobacteroides sp.]